MADGDNADGKWSEKKMEAEDGLRTVECLRGRLLAERATSRAAKEEAEKMGNKLIELEKQLKEEIKSKNRAEKKLQFLSRKLQSMNIAYVSEESEHSSLMEKSEISSASSNSTVSSSPKEPEDEEPNVSNKNSQKCDIQEQMNTTMSPQASENLKNNILQTSTSNQGTSFPSIDHPFSSANQVTLPEGKTEMAVPTKIVSIKKIRYPTASNKSKQSVLQTETFSRPYSEKSGGRKCSQNYNDLKRNEQSSNFSFENKEIDGENDKDRKDDCVDNSLALVPVDLPKKAQNIDPAVLDATVRDVLAALRHAKEKLQSSMERSPMIKVGSR